IVTHDPAIASSADRVAFMHDGRITRVATALSAGEVLEGMDQQCGEAPGA
ncbi:MAG: ABC transporter ATP-binding protein, partial [Schaalia georgiae]|nr:ABC transporter ATP-binding protein [Schaalia georgiae]